MGVVWVWATWVFSSARARGQSRPPVLQSVHGWAGQGLAGRGRCIWAGRRYDQHAERSSTQPSSGYHGAHTHAHTQRGKEQIGVQGDLGRLDLGMTDFWSVCYTVHCAHQSHRPLCRAHPERAALLLLVPGRRGRGQGCCVGASADADARAARPGLAGLLLDSCWAGLRSPPHGPSIRGGYVPPSCFLSFLLACLEEGYVQYWGTSQLPHPHSIVSVFLLSLSVCPPISPGSVDVMRSA